MEDYSTSYLNPALTIEAERLARQKAALKAQAEQAAQQLGIYAPAQVAPGQNFRSAVTGTDIVMPSAKPSKWALAAPLAANAIRAVAQRGSDADTAAFENRSAQAAREHLAAKPDDTSSETAKLVWAEAGRQIPGLAPVMDAYLQDELIAAPSRKAKLDFDLKKFATEHEQKEAEARERERHNRAAEAGTIEAARIRASTPNYQFVQNAQGDVTPGNTRTGELGAPIAGAGKPSAAVEKETIDAATKKRNASEALRLLSDVDGLIGTATSSGMGSLRDQAYAFFGKSTPAGDAAGELQNVAARLLAFADKSGLGPQFSDADRKFLESASSGGIGDPNVPESRKIAVLARIRRNLEAQAAGSTENRPGESVRETVQRVASEKGYTAPKFSPQQRESFGQQLMQEWKAATPDQRAMIEQRASSVGITFNGRPYRGGAFNSREAWGEK